MAKRHRPKMGVSLTASLLSERRNSPVQEPASVSGLGAADGRLCHRHAHYQARATVRRALGVDFPAVQLDDLAAHVQTQSHPAVVAAIVGLVEPVEDLLEFARDRKSTRLNSSHGYISYAVFCLKKKKNSLILIYRGIVKHNLDLQR